MKRLKRIASKDIEFKFQIDERMWDKDENAIADFSSYLNESQKKDFFNDVEKIIEEAADLYDPSIESYDFSISNGDIILSIKLEDDADEDDVINSITSLDGEYLDDIDGTRYDNVNIDTDKWNIDNIAIYVNVQEI